MKHLATVMMQLIKREIVGAADADEAALRDAALQGELYALSKRHDVAHLVGDALGRFCISLDSGLDAKFQKQQMLAVWRAQQIEYMKESAYRALTQAAVPFLPLKGAVMRQYYPEAWMRTSSDVDILICERHLDRCVEVLVDQFGYRAEPKLSHDISLYAPNGMHLELHYDLLEDEYLPCATPILREVWQHAAPVAEGEWRYALSDPMFYFYHVAHLAKPFQEGGCGVRPFVDLWLLEHRVEHDVEARNALLERGGLLKFANAVRLLCAVWFDGEAHTDVTRAMEAFLLEGGVYGTMENRVSLQQNKKGGKLRYILSRIFLPYDALKFNYPILQKHKWLMPVMQVRRWFNLLLRGRLRRSMHELNVNAKTTDATQEGMRRLLREIGL